MEEIMKHRGDNAMWLKSLIEFNQINATSQTFADKYGAETKLKFMEHLLQELNDLVSRTTEQVPDKWKYLQAVLESIRLCAREGVSLNPLDIDKNVALILKLSNFDKTENIPINIADEALKCLVNISVKTNAGKHYLISLKGVDKMVEELKTTSIQSSRVFPICRALIYLSLESEAALVLNSQNTFEYLTRLIKDCTENGYPPLTSEILKLIFNMTISIGPLENAGERKEPTPKQIDAFKNLAPYIKKIFQLPLTQLPLKQNALNCIINTPKGAHAHVIDIPMLEKLVEFLKHQLVHNNSQDGLLEILVTLSDIARYLPEGKEYLQKAILPEKISEEVTMDGPSGDSLSMQIRHLMISSSVVLKHYSQDLLYTLCDDDAEKFAKVTGLGYGAGLLQEKGMLGLFQKLIPNANTPKKQEQRVEELSDSDEEKELEELAAKMQRLQELGHFKVMKKDEQK